MKFLADENIPLGAVTALRQSGFDVASVAESNTGAQDPSVLDQAAREGRVLITFDKDFADLLFHQSPVRVPGVVLLRIRPQSPGHIMEILKSLLESERTWEGFFSVVSDTRIRMAPLPKA